MEPTRWVIVSSSAALIGQNKNMKIICDLKIDRISEIRGEYPGSVDVYFHREGGNLAPGERDGFEARRVSLSPDIINVDGSVNADRVNAEVEFAIGGKETLEIEDEVAAP